jgi:hypothetical protein
MDHQTINPELVKLTKLPLPPHIVIVPESEERFTFLRCGHTSFRTYHVEIWGESLRMSEVSLAQTEYCPACATKMALLGSKIIRCPLCKKPIFKGEGVTLINFQRFTESNELPEGAERHEDSIIACLRMDCCPSGGCMAGNWDGERFQPLLERMTSWPLANNPRDHLHALSSSIPRLWSGDSFMQNLKAGFPIGLPALFDEYPHRVTQSDASTAARYRSAVLSCSLQQKARGISAGAWWDDASAC